MKGQKDIPVRFFFLAKGVQLRNRKNLKSFLLKLLSREGRKASYVNYIFCSDEYLLDINRQFLKHDYYTDIITFNLSQSPTLEAEIYISIDRIRDNSKSHKTTIKEETLRVMFHGLLHLSGYKDKTAAQQREMKKRENYYLTKYLQ